MPRITHTREDGMVLQRQECPAFTVTEEGGGLVLCGSTLGNAFNARFALTAGELEVLLRFVATELPAAFAKAQRYLDPQVPRPVKPIDGCLSVAQPCARAHQGFSDPCGVCQGKKDPRDDDLKLSPEQIAAIFASGRHESIGSPNHEAEAARGVVEFPESTVFDVVKPEALGWKRIGTRRDGGPVYETHDGKWKEFVPGKAPMVTVLNPSPVEHYAKTSAEVLDFPPPDPSEVEHARKMAESALGQRLPVCGPIVAALEGLMRALIAESQLPAINMHPDHVAVKHGNRMMVGPPELVIKPEQPQHREPPHLPYEPGEDRF